MTVNVLVTCSVIFAGVSVILQTIAFIIPGWLILETDDYSVSMALWYVTMCGKLNSTDPTINCQQYSYNGFINERNEVSVSHLRTYYC